MEFVGYQNLVSHLEKKMVNGSCPRTEKFYDSAWIPWGTLELYKRKGVSRMSTGRTKKKSPLSTPTIPFADMLLKGLGGINPTFQDRLVLKDGHEPIFFARFVRTESLF